MYDRDNVINSVIIHSGIGNYIWEVKIPAFKKAPSM